MCLPPKVFDLDGCFSREKPYHDQVTLLRGRVLSERASGSS